MTPEQKRQFDQLKKLAEGIRFQLEAPPTPEFFVDIAPLIPPGRIGDFEVDHFEITKEQAALENLKMANRGQGRERLLEARTYARLLVNNKVMMSDVPFERRTNAEFFMRAEGDVLIAGLGLGMIILPAAFKPSVRRIHVIEKYREVAELVEPHLRRALGPLADKLAVQLEDIATMRLPKKGTSEAEAFRFDSIYFDIWPTVDPANLKEIQKLKRRFKPYLREGGWMAAWAEDLIRQRQRQIRDLYRKGAT